MNVYLRLYNVIWKYLVKNLYPIPFIKAKHATAGISNSTIHINKIDFDLHCTEM